MRNLKFIFFLMTSYVFSQSTFIVTKKDSLGEVISIKDSYPVIIKDSIRDAFIDDYKNLYVYRNSDDSIIKFDSLGKNKSILTLAHPHKIVSSDNPMTIFLFSENSQEFKLIDANLNEIQSFDFTKTFGQVKAVYVEDLQNIWLVDQSKKSLIYYNYRNSAINKSFPLKIDPNVIVDFIVYDQKIYVLTENNFSVYDFDNKVLFSQDIGKGRKLKRNGQAIYVLENNSIYSYTPEKGLNVCFGKEIYKIVDKNSTHFLALIYDKFYLYHQEK